jgi:hypothetical protein
MDKPNSSVDDRLCFLPARAVELPSGRAEGWDIHSSDNRALGTLQGVLVEPAERRLRYFVVESRGWLSRQQYIVSANHVVRLDRTKQVLRLEADREDVRREAFDKRSVREFSDDDLITALFHSRAA